MATYLEISHIQSLKGMGPNNGSYFLLTIALFCFKLRTGQMIRLVGQLSEAECCSVQSSQKLCHRCQEEKEQAGDYRAGEKMSCPL